MAPFPTLDSWNSARAAKNLPPVTKGDQGEADDEAVASPDAAGGAEGEQGGALERIVERLGALNAVIGPKLE